jgi:AcrR family transcriptional regulator
MAAVAADAGVSLKTVYVVFETKSGLLRAVWHRWCAAMVTAFRLVTSPGSGACWMSPTRLPS